MIKSWMCKGGWIEYAGGNYPVKLQKYKNDVKYLQIFRGGWIESAGGNYPLKLPPQLPTVSGRAQQCGCVMRKRGISTPSLFPLLPPSRPLLYEANRRRDQRRRNITHHYNPMQLKPSGRQNCATIQSLVLQRR